MCVYMCTCVTLTHLTQLCTTDSCDIDIEVCNVCVHVHVYVCDIDTLDTAVHN